MRQTAVRGLSEMLPLLAPREGREAEVERLLERWGASVQRWESGAGNR